MWCGSGGRNTVPLPKTGVLKETSERDCRAAQSWHFDAVLVLTLRRSLDATTHNPSSQSASTLGVQDAVSDESAGAAKCA